MNAVEDHANWTISREVGLTYTLSGQVITIYPDFQLNVDHPILIGHRGLMIIVLMHFNLLSKAYRFRQIYCITFRTVIG